VWLLQVRSATQVSTYAYVNPVVAVLLGVLLANENITLLQVVGLVIILGSVLIINIAKHRKEQLAVVGHENTSPQPSSYQKEKAPKQVARDHAQ
jgi:EamA domain-containing membrane protein RarD